MEIVKRVVADNDILNVLRSKPFSLMILSEFFSQLAFNMQHFVIIFIIYGLTHSNTAVSGIILSFTIPAVFFSLISGVYVDRWNKKKVLFFTNLIRGILLIPFLILDLHVGFIYLLTFLIAIATQFFLPAESSVIPRLVPRHLILSAISIFSLGIYGTVLLGYILSGPLILLLGKTYVVVLLVFLFFISTVFIFFMKLSPLDPKSKSHIEVENSRKITLSFADETREIFSFLRKAKKVMHALIILTISQAIIFVFAVLGPGYVSTILNVQIESLSWILIAPAALGMGIGAFLLGSVGSRIEGKWLSTIGFVISGTIFMLLPFVNQVAIPNIFNVTMLQIVIVLAFVIGVANSLIFIPCNAAIQLHTSEHIRGRVYGLLNALIGAISFLPVVLAGGFADIFGVGTVVGAIGFLMVLFSVVFFIVGKRI